MNSTRTRAALAGCLLAVAALAAAGLLTGSFPLSFSEILRDPGGLSARVFWQLRLPRTLMGLAGGWALGMAGACSKRWFPTPWPRRTSPASPRGRAWVPRRPACWARAGGFR